MFGHPDLGALIIKTDRGTEFFKDRKYFGGGTVESLALGFCPRKQNLVDSLEDGTLPFHSIVALVASIEQYSRIFSSFSEISSHVSRLSQYAYNQLAQLRHSNGSKVCELYSTGCYSDPTRQGPIITFNLKDKSGDWIGYSEVEKVANASNISIRTGTLCNSGAACRWIGITDDDIIENHAKGHICNDGNDIIDGKATGAVRISFGCASSADDFDKFFKLIVDYYIDRQLPTIGGVSSRSAIVESITIFPIKSCGGFKIDGPWRVNAEGFKWDRQFCLVERTKMQVMSLKKHTRMALIKPSIIDDCLMRVNFNGRSISIALGTDDASSCSSVSSSSSLSASDTTLAIVGKVCSKRIAVCGDNTEVSLYEDSEIVQFFSSALGVDCTLGKLGDHALRFHKPDVNGPLQTTGKEATNIPITMSNASPILLISRASVRRLGPDIDDDVFRGNIVVSGLSPYAEDNWKELIIGASRYKVCDPTPL
jgi:molybdenum cofactor sulfurtransferase